ncbi:hypothetical protein C8A05DRAFT_39437, partial [Staphylotrichum tortipilum]
MITILDEEELVASAVVFPGSTQEVQQVVRWANKHLIPIFPISMGRNLSYGGAAPRVRGSVTVDLGRRINTILDINAEDYTCLVEPGVSYYALYKALKARGLDEHMWIDTPDLGGGSVIGNAVDRGVGYTPYGDHWACHAGLEVVLPSGEVIRTGIGALPGNNSWQLFPYGFGPFSEGYEAFMYTFKNDEDLVTYDSLTRYPLDIVARAFPNKDSHMSELQLLSAQTNDLKERLWGVGVIRQTDKMTDWVTNDVNVAINNCKELMLAVHDDVETKLAAIPTSTTYNSKTYQKLNLGNAWRKHVYALFTEANGKQKDFSA